MDISEHSLKSTYNLTEADEYKQLMSLYRNCDLIKKYCDVNSALKNFRFNTINLILLMNLFGFIFMNLTN